VVASDLLTAIAILDPLLLPVVSTGGRGSGLPLPVLYKHYSQATSPDGVAFTAFNIDRDFGDCVDSFVIADLHKLTPRKRQRYL